MKYILSLLLLACSIAHAQTTVHGGTHITVLPPGASVMPAYDAITTNWANSGLAKVGGIPSRSTICATLNPVGGVPSGGSGDNASNINAAINSCPAGQVVFLTAGAQTSINITVSGNNLTLNSGTLAVGEVISCATGCQPGMTVTGGGGSSWTVSYGPYVGTSISAEAATATVAYNVLGTETIFLSKGITLRGSTCGASSCATIINQYNGALPNWSFASENSNANCGISTTGSTNFCFSVASGPIIQMGSFANGWNGTPVLTPTTPTGTTSLTADAAQGATQIQVNSVSAFSVGQIVLIDEAPALVSTNSPASGTLNTQIGASSDFLSSTITTADNRIANPDAGLGACNSSNGTTYAWSLFCNRVNAELHVISCIGTACTGGNATTLGFDSPLTIAFKQSGGHNAQVYLPTSGSSASSFLNGAGIENITTYRGGDTDIQIQFCIYCYIQNADGAMFVHGHIQIEWALRNQVDVAYSHLTADAENNGTEYPWAIDAGSTENRIENSTTVLGGKCMVMRASGGGNVLANNYMDRTFYQNNNIGAGWMDMCANASHYAGTHGTLFEGNWADNGDGDETHGNNTLEVFYRNYLTGTRSNFVVPDTGGTVSDASGGNVPLRAAGPMAFGYWFAYVGNVMGTIGTSTAANGWTYYNPYVGNSGGGCSSNVGTRAIWMSGWVGGEWNCIDANLKNNANPQFIFKNANYDTVNAAIIDNASEYSQTLPDSLYTPSKPSYFAGASCTYTWPWVTSQASPFVLSNSCSGSGNPAKARFDAGTFFAQP